MQCAASDAIRLELIAAAQLSGAEVVAYEPGPNMLFITAGERLGMMHLGSGQPAFVRWVEVSVALPPHVGEQLNMTHVAVDPIRRGFGVVTVAPRDVASQPGWIVFFSTRTGEVLSSLPAGFLPDAVAFTKDGSRLVIANEGEPVEHHDGGWTDPPGSVSVVDLTRVSSSIDCRTISQADVRTIYFTGPALAAALSPEAGAERLRIHPLAASSPAFDIEPEYVTIADDAAYFSLQENNGLAALDLQSLAWRRISGLGSIDTLIDASDRDGGAHVRTRVSALPMPDMIASYEVKGAQYIVSANEGDSRAGVFADSARLADLASEGRISAAAANLFDLSETGAGRLNVCSFSGDLDHDGVLDQPVALGARSLAVWRADTFELVSHTGSDFEMLMAIAAPEHFNSQDEVADARSDVRGPEPEGVALGRIADGRVIAFVGLERPGAIAMVDVTDPRSIRTIEVSPTSPQGLRGPEGMIILPPDQSPTGEAMLIVAFEASGHVATFRIITD